MALVAQDAQRQTVGHARHPVVELRERIFVSSGNEGDECFVGQMSVVLAHGEAVLGPGQS